MQRQLSLSDSEDAISPIIGTVLILAIMVSITGTMLAWGIPQIQESEAYAIYTSAQNNFLNFDADLDQVIIQGEGSSRSSTVSFSAGTFVHRENLDEIRYYYETTTWSSFEILGIKNEATSFAIIDNKAVIDNFDITISYPNGTTWEGESSAHIVSGFPALVYGTTATYSSTENSTVVGGFFVYGVDSLSYKYSSVSGVCSFSSSFIHPAEFSDFSKSNRPVLITSFKLTIELLVGIILASGFNLFIMSKRFLSSGSETKSVLFKRITLANSTWSVSKSTIVLSSFSISVKFLSVRYSGLEKSFMKLYESTTVTMVST